MLSYRKSTFHFNVYIIIAIFGIYSQNVYSQDNSDSTNLDSLETWENNVLNDSTFEENNYQLVPLLSNNDSLAAMEVSTLIDSLNLSSTQQTAILNSFSIYLSKLDSLSILDMSLDNRTAQLMLLNVNYKIKIQEILNADQFILYVLMKERKRQCFLSKLQVEGVSYVELPEQ